MSTSLPSCSSGCRMASRDSTASSTCGGSETSSSEASEQLEPEEVAGVGALGQERDGAAGVVQGPLDVAALLRGQGGVPVQAALPDAAADLLGVLQHLLGQVLGVQQVAALDVDADQGGGQAQVLVGAGRAEAGGGGTAAAPASAAWLRSPAWTRLCRSSTPVEATPTAASPARARVCSGSSVENAALEVAGALLGRGEHEQGLVVQAARGAAGADDGLGAGHGLGEVAGDQGVAGVLELELGHALLGGGAAVAQEVGGDVEPVGEPLEHRVARGPLAGLDERQVARATGRRPPARSGRCAGPRGPRAAARPGPPCRASVIRPLLGPRPGPLRAGRS